MSREKKRVRNKEQQNEIAAARPQPPAQLIASLKGLSITCIDNRGVEIWKGEGVVSGVKLNIGKGEKRYFP